MFKNQYIRKPDFKNIASVLDYNDYWEHRGWKLNEKLKSREQIALQLIPEGAKIIDIGCGNSLFPVKLKEKKCNVMVSDISDVVLKGYSEYGISGKVLDLDTLDGIGDFDSDYDYVILFEVLEHLKHSEEVVKKLSSHTRYFMITVPNSAAYFYRLGLLFQGRFFTQWVMHPSEHLRFWSYIDFCDWLDAIGLQVNQTVATDGSTFLGFLPFLRNIWKNMFANRVLYVCSIKNKHC